MFCRLFTLFLFLSSCAHSKNEYKYLSPITYDDHSCLKHLDEFRRTDLEKTLDNSVQGFGIGASYLITGAGYTSDFIIFLSAGVGVGIVVCSPLFAIEGALRSNGRASFECVGKVGESVMKEMPTGLGESAYQETHALRCPEVDYISKSLRKVASCYKEQGDFSRAKEQLQNIKEDSLLKKCSSTKERVELQEDLKLF